MSDIIQRIKNISHDVSEGYLLYGEDMNDAIIKKADDIDNHEMLKRICEHANQNVYLAKFQDSENRSNIIFDIADFNLVKQSIDESEKSMELYDTPPEDFRSALEITVETRPEPEQEKTSLDRDAVYEASEYRQRFSKFANSIEMMKTAAIEEFESNFNLLYHGAKRLTAHGDSLGDMAKIASRCVVEDGLSPTNIMKAYDIIEKELVKSGFDVNTEFTKLSSMKINHNSISLRPVKEMSMAIEKIAALEEMEKNIKVVVNAFDNLIKKNA